MKRISSTILTIALMTGLSVYSGTSLAEMKIGFVDTVKLMEAAPAGQVSPEQDRVRIRTQGKGTGCVAA